MANGGVERVAKTARENSGCLAGGAIVVEKGQLNRAGTGMLIRGEAHQNSRRSEGFLKGGRSRTPGARVIARTIPSRNSAAGSDESAFCVWNRSSRKVRGRRGRARRPLEKAGSAGLRGPSERKGRAGKLALGTDDFSDEV